MLSRRYDKCQYGRGCELISVTRTSMWKVQETYTYTEYQSIISHDQTYVWSILLFGNETWAVTKALLRFCKINGIDTLGAKCIK